MSIILKCPRRVSVSVFAAPLLSLALLASALPAAAQQQQNVTEAQLARQQAIEACVAQAHSQSPGENRDAQRQRAFLYASCMNSKGLQPYNRHPPEPPSASSVPPPGEKAIMNRTDRVLHTPDRSCATYTRLISQVDALTYRLYCSCSTRAARSGMSLTL